MVVTKTKLIFVVYKNQVNFCKQTTKTKLIFSKQATKIASIFSKWQHKPSWFLEKNLPIKRHHFETNGTQ